jgi:hypothetical protein
VILGESTGIRQLGAGESVRVSGSPTIDLDLEGFGRLTATGPAQSATELKEQLGTTIGLIDGFAARFGTSEVAELRQRHQESTGLELQSANEEKAVRGLLNGRTVKSLRADAGRLDEEVEAAEGLHPDWRKAPPDPGNLKHQLAEARKAFDERCSSVTANWKQRQSDLAGAQKLVPACHGAILARNLA